MLEAREAVKKLHAYRPPLAGRTGLRLDFNESTMGCSPRVLARLRSLDAELPGALSRARAGGKRGREFSRTRSGTGLAHERRRRSDSSALFHVSRSWGRSAHRRAHLRHVLRSLLWPKARALSKYAAGDNFVFPAQQLLAQISPRTRLIAVANPNNPTGAAVAGNVLMQIAQAAPQAAVLVDEAYFEFHGETLIARTRQIENLFVARTFSKAYGLAGLRIGILAGEARQMAMVRRVASPYSVNAGRARSSARGASRSGICQPLCRASATQSREIAAGTWQSRVALLAEPREFCPGPHRLGPRGICSSAARPRNSGARPALRSRMRRLRPPDRGNGRTHADSHLALREVVEAAWVANWVARRFAKRGAGVRKAKLHRKTAETEIQIALTIEGRGKYEVSTGIRFLDHMLELFARHGGFDLKLAARGRPGCGSAPHRGRCRHRAG